MNILQRLLTKLTPKPTHITMAGIKLNTNNITQATQRNIDEIVKLSQTKEWEAHVKRLHSDPQYLAKEIERMDDEFNEQNYL